EFYTRLRNHPTFPTRRSSDLVACQPNCRGWISAVGIVSAETPSDFDAFARDHQLKGETVVLDSGGGSVNDAIALGRRFRALEMRSEEHTSELQSRVDLVCRLL